MVERCSRLTEEGAEYTHLEQQYQSGVEHHDQRVYSPFRHHRSQCLRERDALIALQYATPGELTDAGYHQRGCIAQEYAIGHYRCPRLESLSALVQRLQRLPPPPGTEQLCQNAKRK